MKKWLSVLCVAGILTGCSLIPDYDRPDVKAPDNWKEGKAPLSEQTLLNADWWKNFNSPELNALMDKALAGNNDLQAAVARIAEARADLRIAGGALQPAIDASGKLTEAKTTPGPKWQNSGTPKLAVSYELDLFGKNRSAVEAAKARATGSEYDHDALALVVMSDVAKGYFSLVNLRQRINIAEDNLNNQRGVMKIIQARFEAGSASALDVSRQKSEVATNEAALAALRSQAASAEDALSVLMGEAPERIALRTKGLWQIRTPKIPLTQPARITAQRPDIRKSEQDLLAANADIGAARAAFFPDITLGGDVGAVFSPLSNAATRSAELFSALTAPIFHGGALRGGVDKAKARRTELASDYRSTVLNALREVEDALAETREMKVRERALAVSVAESRRSYELSRQLYEAGSVDYQTLLDSQRTLLSAEDSHAAAELDLLSAAVDLYKALGGGWGNKETAPGPKAAQPETKTKAKAKSRAKKKK